jgi:hypothetical protein
MPNGARNLLKLFVDDGALAASLIAVVVSAKVAVLLLPEAPSAAVIILVLGSLAALLFSIARADPA